MVQFKQAFRIALGSIGSAKLRSALTTLGIVIGVAAVITNASLGASFNQFFTDEVSPRKGMSGELSYLSETKNVDIAGVSEDFREIQNLQLEEGSFLTDKDSYSAVLGYDLANEEFDRKISDRGTVEIAFRQEDGSVVRKTFKVKGILENSKETIIGGNGDTDSMVFIPVSTMNEMLGEKDYGAFFAMASSPESVSVASDEVDKRLARNFGIPRRDLEDEDAKPYGVVDQAEILEQTGQMGDALGSFLLAVALISLLVGSIGIMNIMLVTVTERTREVGILKSLGYTNSGVLSLFLLESVLVSLFGGILGTILGGLGAYALETALKLPPVFPFRLIEIGFLVSVLVGVVAGVYPARKAARMNPVDALRYE